MLQIDDKILSLDILEKKFVCNLSKCKGACCVQGDSGAPLEKEEAEKLDEIYDDIKPYLRKEGINAIDEQGKHIIDSDGDVVTPLVNNAECAYAYFDENKIAKCAIETAYNEGKTDFIKPISCHLYPIRRKKYKTFEGLNYDKWEICKPATKYGRELNVRIYQFLEKPLIRAYGKEWYKKLQIAADELINVNG